MGWCGLCLHTIIKWLSFAAAAAAAAAGDPWDTFRRTLSGRFYVPHFITDAAADLIFKLLQVGGKQLLLRLRML
jgi:hypothetical protein